MRQINRKELHNFFKNLEIIFQHTLASKEDLKKSNKSRNK